MDYAVPTLAYDSSVLYINIGDKVCGDKLMMEVRLVGYIISWQFYH